MTDLLRADIMTDLLREKIVQINPLQKKQPLVGSNKADIWIILVNLQWEILICHLQRERLVGLRQDNSSWCIARCAFNMHLAHKAG